MARPSPAKAMELPACAPVVAPSLCTALGDSQPTAAERRCPPREEEEAALNQHRTDIRSR